MPLILGAQSATASSYGIDNSCRFNASDSAYMHRTFGTPTNIDKWTFSVWLKRGGVFTGAAQKLLNAYVSGSAYHMVHLSGGATADRFSHYDHDTAMTPADIGETTAGDYRDPSSWYHLVVIYDSGNADADSRSKLFVNGVEPEFSSVTNPGANNDSVINRAIAHQLGAVQSPAQYYDGYMAEVLFFDGQAYNASEFGEYDSDSPSIWKPKDPSGLTFSGTNSCWLDFKDSADLGKDVSGQGNHFTEVNFAAGDQATDSPTNNFNIMLPIMKQASNLTFSEGNLAVAWPIAATWRTIYSSIMPTSGKWYWEVKVTASADRFVGIVGEAGVDNTDDSSLGVPATAYSIKEDGNKYNNNVSASYGVSTTTNDIVGVAMDLDNGTVWFSKNGTWMNSATQEEVAAGTTTNAAYSSITVGAAYPFGPAVAGKESAAFSFNFGSPPYAISSGNADGNGYGDFEYAVPSGFYALCTKNLAEFG